MNKIKSFFNFVNNKPFTTFEEFIVNSFTKLPKIPKEITDLIVSVGPYLVLLGGVIGVLSMLTIFSLGNTLFLSVYAGLTAFLPFLYLTIIVSVFTGIMMIASFNELLQKNLFGWRLVFWAFTISVISMIITLNIIGALISAIISFYILISVKEYYR